MTRLSLTMTTALVRLNGGAAEATPALDTQLHYVRTLYDGVCALYGMRVGLKHARKHLGWALDAAAETAGAPEVLLRQWRARVLPDEDPGAVKRGLADAFAAFAWIAAA